jgi:hypothetical protein
MKSEVKIRKRLYKNSVNLMLKKTSNVIHDIVERGKPQEIVSAMTSIEELLTKITPTGDKDEQS